MKVKWSSPPPEDDFQLTNPINLPEGEGKMYTSVNLYKWIPVCMQVELLPLVCSFMLRKRIR